MEEIRLGEMAVQVERKGVKNVHLSVYPPKGRVKIVAPERMAIDTIRLFAISKLGWIKSQQVKFTNQEREAGREYTSRESHYFLGQRYLLNVIEKDAPPKVVRRARTLDLYIRPGTSPEKREDVLLGWYRSELKAIVEKQVAHWEKRLKVSVANFGIKVMKTKWGSCNIERRRIWLNLELAKKPLDCIEYIVVHEMVHLLERNHGKRFQDLMTKFLPDWRDRRAELNRLPVARGEWKY
jgi:hypothetical protein